MALAGCGLVPSGQGNPSEPVLVRGRVLDAAGGPVNGATLELDVRDYGAAIDIGDVVPTVFHQSFTANADGTFELHLAPTSALLAFGKQEGGFINFDLVAHWGTTVAPWAFTRHLDGLGWAGDPELLELRPIGVPVDGPGGPGVPAPLPAGT